MNDKHKTVAGYNQFLKLVRKNRAAKIYLASDADRFFVSKVKSELAGRTDVVLVTSYTSSQLAEMSGIDVPTAVLTEISE